MAKTEPVTGWGGKLISVLENIAAGGNTAPPEAERVVTMPGLDKLHRSVRELQGRLVTIDSQEHALLLGYQEVEKVVEEQRQELAAKRAEVVEQMRQHQEKIVDAVKSCGIRAEIVTRGPADAS